MSTGGGAELGCIVALKVLEICGRPEVRSMVHYIAERFRERAARDPGDLSRLARRHPPGRRRDGARVRPPAGREARHAAAVRERRVGDLLDARPARAPVQAGDPARARRWSTRSSTGRRWRSARRWPTSAGGGGGMSAVLEASHSDPPGAPARAHDARPRALGGHRVRRPTTASGRSGWSTRSPKRHTKTPKGSLWRRSRRPGWASPSTSGARTRRARAGSPSATRSATTSTRRSTPRRRSSRCRSRPASCSRSRRRRTRSRPSTSRSCWR